MLIGLVFLSLAFRDSRPSPKFPSFARKQRGSGATSDSIQERDGMGPIQYHIKRHCAALLC